MEVVIRGILVACCLRFAEGFQVVYDQRASGTATAQLFRQSLAACVRKCKCFSGCTVINYYRHTQQCELFVGPVSSLDPQPSRGCVIVEVARISPLWCAFTEDCLLDGVVTCPEPEIIQDGLLLGSGQNGGNKLSLMCDECFSLVGSRSTTCAVDGDWSEPLGQCLDMSTMRDPCVTNDDCVDDNSECRDGQCWCLKGLSYNPACHTCVPLCPGDSYGTTFQEVHAYYILESNFGPTAEVSSMEECMALCLSFPNADAPYYTCKYVDFDDVVNPYECFLNDIADGVAPTLSYWGSTWYLQRDCAVPGPGPGTGTAGGGSPGTEEWSRG